MAKRKTALVMISVGEKGLVVTDGNRRYEFPNELLYSFKRAARMAARGTGNGSDLAFNVFCTNVYGFFKNVDDRKHVKFCFQFDGSQATLDGTIAIIGLFEILNALG